MARIMIKCPKTGKPVPTGVVMDAASFATASLTGNRVKCPHCPETHRWDKKDAWLEEVH